MRAITGMVATNLIIAGVLFGQTWNGGSGNWGAASNWTTGIVPNSSSATAAFSATGVTSDVFLSGGPFTVGTLNISNDVSGGFAFQSGTLQLAGAAEINVESHNAPPDFCSYSTIALRADTTVDTVFSDSTLLIGGTITDIGGGSGLTKIGQGMLTLTGTSTYGGSTGVEGGTMTIQNGGKLSDAGGFIFDPGGIAMTVAGAGSTWTNEGDLLVLVGAMNIQNGGKVSDADGIIGAFTPTGFGNGVVIVAGVGSTWTNIGDLAVGDDGTGATTIENCGKVLDANGSIGAFFGTGTVTVTGPGSTWTNTGALVVRGGGTLTVENGGTINATATTIGNAGTLAIGASFTLNGSLVIDGGEVRTLANTTFPNNATLNAGGATFDSNGFSSTFSGALSGAGGITKIGTGSATFSGANKYSGGTVINAGTLVVACAEALGLGDVVVNGGALRGDPEPINVKGNYTQNARGTLQLSIGGSAAGQYDFLNVTGHAILDGTLQLISPGEFEPQIGVKLTLVTAGGGIFGQFASVVDSFGLLFLTDLVYGRNALLLEFFGTDFEALAQTPNQLAVAKHLDAAAQNPKEADLVSFLVTEPVPNLPGDFDKISPESLTARYEVGFSAANIQTSNLEERFVEIRNGSTGFSSSLNVSNAPRTVEGKAVVESDRAS